MDELLNQLLKDTFTQTQAQKRLRLLRDFVTFSVFENLNQSFENNFLAFNSKADKSQQNRIDLEWLHLLGEVFFQSLAKNYDHPDIQPAKDQASFTLEAIEKRINALEVATLYIPFETTSGELSDIGKWFKANIGANFLYEISFDANLIGGCALSYKGNYRDFSLRAQINAQKQVIIQSLTSYAK